MKKIFSLLFLMTLVGMLMGGCAPEQKKTEDSGESKTKTEQTAVFPLKVKDASGNEVTIEKKPKRIVSIIPSNTETAYALGLGKEVVGVSDFDNYPSDVKNKEKIGGMEFNVEKILSLKPDLVLTHESIIKSAADLHKQLEDAGIPVVVVNDAQSFDKVYQSIELIGTATGEKVKADQLIDGMKKKIAGIEKKAEGIKEQKKVLFEVSPAPEIYTTGKNTFMDEMTGIIHAKNAAGDQNGWVKLDQEAMIKHNPDVIITTYGGSKQVLDRKGWQDVNAVKTKQVFDVNTDLLTRSGPRLAEGVEELAKTVYPETFKK
ncbi:ABC transporter substrate-binding protein [Actinomycetes bacterium NPDC127524]